MSDQDVEPLRDVVPDPIDGASILHVRPVAEPRGEWASPDPEPLDRLLLVDQEVDPSTLDQITGDEPLLK